jgi:hypothetical protein
MSVSRRVGLAAACLLAGLGAEAKVSVARPTVGDVLAVAAAIDREVEKLLDQEKFPPSPPADDAEFLRRLYLDLTGRIPTAAQATGRTDAEGARVIERPISIVDFLASICQLLGINYRKRLATPDGRRLPIVDLQTQENPRLLTELF